MLIGTEPAPGNCRLIYKGFHQLELQRCENGKIIIDRQMRTIQEPPPTIASRLPVDTDQYIYALWDEHLEKVKLEASTTGPVSFMGIEVKDGEHEKTLVGMGRPFEQRHQHYHWAHRPTSLHILTWYNRRSRSDLKFLKEDFETITTSWDEAAPKFRLEFLTWAGETVRLTANGEARYGGEKPCLALSFDGISPVAEISSESSTPPGAWCPFSLAIETLFEGTGGHHFTTLLARAGTRGPTTVRGGNTSLSVNLIG